MLALSRLGMMLSRLAAGQCQMTSPCCETLAAASSEPSADQASVGPLTNMEARSCHWPLVVSSRRSWALSSTLCGPTAPTASQRPSGARAIADRGRQEWLLAARWMQPPQSGVVVDFVWASRAHRQPATSRGKGQRGPIGGIDQVGSAQRGLLAEGEDKEAILAGYA